MGGWAFVGIAEYARIITSRKKGDIQMAIETLRAVSAQLSLENGRDAHGNMTYVKQSIANISKEGYTADRYLAIVAALEPCLNKDIGIIDAIKTYFVASGS